MTHYTMGDLWLYTSVAMTIMGILCWWSTTPRKPKPKQYRYDLFGGPYHGKVLVTDQDLSIYTDRSLCFEEHHGFYEIIQLSGFYDIRTPYIGRCLNGFDKEPLLLEEK